MKIWYFENTHRDKSNDILYNIIYLCILVEKYGQSKLGQNYIFSNGSFKVIYHLIFFADWLIKITNNERNTHFTHLNFCFISLKGNRRKINLS